MEMEKKIMMTMSNVLVMIYIIVYEVDWVGF